MNQESNKEILDATGTPIQIGAMYGYSTSKNGFTTTVIGKCKSIKKHTVTLCDTETKTYLYARDGKAPKIEIQAATRAVVSVILFPVTR